MMGRTAFTFNSTPNRILFSTLLWALSLSITSAMASSAGYFLGFDFGYVFFQQRLYLIMAATPNDAFYSAYIFP